MRDEFFKKERMACCGDILIRFMLHQTVPKSDSLSAFSASTPNRWVPWVLFGNYIASSCSRGLLTQLVQPCRSLPGDS